MAIIEVDFTGVTSGAGYLEPGTYRAQVESVDRVEGRNYPGLKWTWRSVEDASYGQQADQFISLAPKALFVLKGALEALGAKIPQSVLRFDTDKLIGKKAFIRVVNEPWTDSAGVERPSSKVDRVLSVPNAVPDNGSGQAEFKVKAPASLMTAKAAPLGEADDVDFGDESDIPF